MSTGLRGALRARSNTWLAACLLGLVGCGGGGGNSGVQHNGAGTGAGTVQVSTTPSPADPTTAPATPEETITLLALHSPGAASLYPDVALRVNHLVNVANTVARSSGSELTLTLVHIASVDYPDDYGMIETLEALTLATDPAFADVAALRDEHAADLVTFLRPYANDGLCGYAWRGGTGGADFSNPAEADFGYSTVAIDCSDYTLIHELGHNLGLAHSRREDPTGGSLTYGAGHGVDNDFVTVMATATEFNAVKFGRFSSPEQSCHQQPCGVTAADPVNGADAVSAVGFSWRRVAAYR